MEPFAAAIAKIQLLRGDVAISVGLSWCLLDDDALECLKDLPQLRELYLSHTEVTDAGLEHLKGLRQLQTLDLGGTNITDAGLEHLKDLRLLQTLDLSGTDVTDAGLEHLKDLLQLQALYLHGAKVTDAGLERLQALRQLQELGLGNTEVTDAGLEHLRGLPELEKLCYWATGAGLKHRRGLPRLRELDLGGTKVTDAGLEHLKGLGQLQSLGLSGTEVSDAGMEHLKGLRQLRMLDLRSTWVKGPLNRTEWSSHGPQFVGLDANPAPGRNTGRGRGQANSQARHGVKEHRQPARPGKAGMVLSAGETMRELERRLHHAQRLEGLGVLAGGIAHDINNILAGMMGYADLALLQLSASTPARADIEVIKKSVLRATALTQRMLAYSGKDTFNVEAVNLSQIVADSQQMLAMLVSKTATITYCLASNLPMIQVDAVQMCQVIMNLVINASEALGEQGGAIAVSTAAIQCEGKDLAGMGFGQDLADGIHICLAVADTGCGMDEQTVAKIFDPYFTTKVTGRGLGLASVYGIVRSLKGTIQVSSEPGKGTTFRVLFPANGSNG